MFASSLFQHPNFWCQDSTLCEIATRQFAKYRKHYTGAVTSVSSSGCEARIPRVFHFIWLGSPLPDKYQRMIDTWQCQHPTWEIILWNDSKVESFEMTNALNFKQAPNFGMKSDILRYEILESQGGVYVDIDYECVRNIEDIVDHCDFFAGFSHTTALELNNGLIGCVSHHAVMRRLVGEITALAPMHAVLRSPDIADSIAQFLGQQAGLSLQQPTATVEDCVISPADTIAQTGPGLLTRVICQCLAANSCIGGDEENSGLRGVLLLPVDVFHPVPNNVHVCLEDAVESIEDLKSRHVTAKTVAIHWWQCSWQC